MDIRYIYIDDMDIMDIAMITYILHEFTWHGYSGVYNYDYDKKTMDLVEYGISPTPFMCPSLLIAMKGLLGCASYRNRQSPPNKKRYPPVN